MDLATLVLIFCVLFFGYRGYKAGLVVAAGRIAALVGGYAASLLLSESVSPWLQQQFQWSAVASLIVAGVGLFLIISAGINALVKLLFSAFPKALRTSSMMKLSGAGLGAASGFVVAVLTLWFYGLLMGAIGVAAPQLGERLKTTAESHSSPNSLGQQVVEKTSAAVADLVMEQTPDDDPVAQATAMIMTQPQATMESFQRLSQNQHLRALLQSPYNQQVLASGDPQQVKQLSDFQALRQNPDMAQLFNEDLLSDQQLSELLVTYWQRAENLRNDAELQEALNDPALQQSLQQGNMLAVLTHPGGNKLLKALLSPTDSTTTQRETTYTTTTETDSVPTNTETKTLPVNNQVYQWVDDEGRTHFSDEKPR